MSRKSHNPWTSTRAGQIMRNQIDRNTFRPDFRSGRGYEAPGLREVLQKLGRGAKPPQAG